jgi:hypothetical protein
VSAVRNDLFLGGRQLSVDREKMSEMGITHVINCTPDLPCHFEGEFKYFRVGVADSNRADIGAHFAGALEFFGAARAGGGKVLVHCSMGVSRSATIVLAVLMRFESMSLRDALAMVESKRACVRPNCGFFEQLIALEKEVRGSVSLTLQEYREKDGLSIVDDGWTKREVL